MVYWSIKLVVYLQLVILDPWSKILHPVYNILVNILSPRVNGLRIWPPHACFALELPVPSPFFLFSLLFKIVGSTWLYHTYNFYHGVQYCTILYDGSIWSTVLHLTTETMALHHSTFVLYQTFLLGVWLPLLYLLFVFSLLCLLAVAFLCLDSSNTILLWVMITCWPLAFG